MLLVVVSDDTTQCLASKDTANCRVVGSAVWGSWTIAKSAVWCFISLCRVSERFLDAGWLFALGAEVPLPHILNKSERSKVKAFGIRGTVSVAHRQEKYSGSRSLRWYNCVLSKHNSRMDADQQL